MLIWSIASHKISLQQQGWFTKYVLKVCFPLSAPLQYFYTMRGKLIRHHLGVFWWGVGKNNHSNGGWTMLVPNAADVFGPKVNWRKKEIFRQFMILIFFVSLSLLGNSWAVAATCVLAFYKSYSPINSTSLPLVCWNIITTGQHCWVLTTVPALSVQITEHASYLSEAPWAEPM